MNVRAHAGHALQVDLAGVHRQRRRRHACILPSPVDDPRPPSRCRLVRAVERHRRGGTGRAGPVRPAKMVRMPRLTGRWSPSGAPGTIPLCAWTSTPTSARASGCGASATTTALLDVVTSANVACGFHAGDPRTMRRVCAAAADARRGDRRAGRLPRPRRLRPPPDRRRLRTTSPPTSSTNRRAGRLRAGRRHAGALRQAARRALQHRGRRPGQAARGGRGRRRLSTGPCRCSALPGSALAEPRTRPACRSSPRRSPTAPTCRAAGWSRAANPARCIEDPYEVVARAAAFALHQRVTAVDGTVLAVERAVAVRARRHPGRGRTSPARSGAASIDAGVTLAPFAVDEAAAATATRALLVEPDDPARRAGAARPRRRACPASLEVVPARAHGARPCRAGRRRRLRRAAAASSLRAGAPRTGRRGRPGRARRALRRRRTWPTIAAELGLDAGRAGPPAQRRRRTSSRSAASRPASPTWPGWTPRCTCRGCAEPRTPVPAGSVGDRRRVHRRLPARRRRAAGGCSAAPTPPLWDLDRTPPALLTPGHPRPVPRRHDRGPRARAAGHRPGSRPAGLRRARRAALGRVRPRRAAAGQPARRQRRRRRGARGDPRRARAARARAVTVALTGAACPALDWGAAVTVPGRASICGSARRPTGLRSYLAVRGGIAVDRRARLAQHRHAQRARAGAAARRRRPAGRRAAAGDGQRRGRGRPAPPSACCASARAARRLVHRRRACDASSTAEWTVRPDSDRVGMRLDGPRAGAARHRGAAERADAARRRAGAAATAGRSCSARTRR